jgi:hypothetical protein
VEDHQEKENKTMKHQYWDEAAAAAIVAITMLDHPSRAGTLEKLRKIEDDLITRYFDKEDESSLQDTKDAKHFWGSIGSEALVLAWRMGNPLVPNEIIKTLISKQRDYGPENIRRFGRRGLIVRMHDKIARLENLTSSSAEPNNESIADNLLDVVGYAAIGIMLEDENFLLPLKPYALPTNR